MRPMKNKYKFMIVALLFAVFTSNNFAQWTSTAVGDGFLDVKFLNEDLGWGVGGSGGIWKTTDGGINWSQQTSGTTTKLVSLDIISTSIVIVVGDTGLILKTNDGGSTWATKSSGTVSTLRSVHFINSTKGFAAGFNGTILKSTDAGDTWTDSSWPVDIRFEGIFFTNSDVGWIAGRAISLKTTDGGDNWEEVTIKSNVYFFYIFFSDLNNGWAVGADQNNSPNNGILLRTTDGGNSWSTEHNLVGSSRIRDVHFVDNSLGWLVGDNGQIFKSTDGGDNWTEEIAESDTVLNAVHFYNEYLGWAAGAISNDGIIRIYDNSPEFTPPNPATNLTAEANDEYSINLTWQDNSNNEDGFIVERRIGTEGSFEAIDTVGVNIETYTNINLNPNTEYCYRIIVYNTTGANSDWAVVCATTDQLSSPQPATNLTAAAFGDSLISLTWLDNSDNEDEFIIRRKLGTGGGF